MLLSLEKKGLVHLDPHGTELSLGRARQGGSPRLPLKLPRLAERLCGDLERHPGQAARAAPDPLSREAEDFVGEVPRAFTEILYPDGGAPADRRVLAQLRTLMGRGRTPYRSLDQAWLSPVWPLARLLRLSTISGALTTPRPTSCSRRSPRVASGC